MSAVFLYAIEGIQLFSPVLTDVVVVDNVILWTVLCLFYGLLLIMMWKFKFKKNIYFFIMFHCNMCCIFRL